MRREDNKSSYKQFDFKGVMGSRKVINRNWIGVVYQNFFFYFFDCSMKSGYVKLS